MQLPRLKEWRESRGLMQKELAAAAGTSEYTVLRAERGTSLRVDTARKLADALGVSVADLLESPPVPLEEPVPLGEAPEVEPLEEEESSPKAELQKLLQSEGVRTMMRELLQSVGAKTQHLARSREELKHYCDGLSLEEVRTFCAEVQAERKLIGPVLDRRNDETVPEEEGARLNVLWMKQFFDGTIAMAAARQRVDAIAAGRSEQQQASNEQARVRPE